MLSKLCIIFPDCDFLLAHSGLSRKCWLRRRHARI